MGYINLWLKSKKGNTLAYFVLASILKKIFYNNKTGWLRGAALLLGLLPKLTPGRGNGENAVDQRSGELQYHPRYCRILRSLFVKMNKRHLAPNIPEPLQWKLFHPFYIS
jgi:hypothetical protein